MKRQLNSHPFAHPSTPAATWLRTDNLRGPKAFLTPNGFRIHCNKAVKSQQIAQGPEIIGCNGRQEFDPE